MKERKAREGLCGVITLVMFIITDAPGKCKFFQKTSILHIKEQKFLDYSVEKEGSKATIHIQFNKDALFRYLPQTDSSK